MEDKNSKSPTKPIVALAVGVVVGLLITVLSLGALGPLDFIVFGLSVVFAGIWVMTNYSFKWSKLLAISLILTPVIFIYIKVINFGLNS